MSTLLKGVALAVPALVLAGIVVDTESDEQRSGPRPTREAAPDLSAATPERTTGSLRVARAVQPHGSDSAPSVTPPARTPVEGLPGTVLRTEGIRKFRQSLDDFMNAVPPESRELLAEALASEIESAHSEAIQRHRRSASRNRMQPMDRMAVMLDAMEQLDGIEPIELATRHATTTLGRPVSEEELAEVGSQIVQERQIRANESAAIATLKNICSAQAQCQASGTIDANGNGAGEFGTFGELSGTTVLRGTTDERFSPPVLSAAFGRVEDSVVVRSGYVFQMWLPQNRAGAYAAEDTTGGTQLHRVDHALCEVIWRCYAWPVNAGESGHRVFVVGPSGDVLAADNANGWSGARRGPPAHAADGAEPWSFAANQRSPSGEQWRVIR